MFDQIQHFTDIAQNFKPAQWGAQIQEQFQHFQGWARPEAVEPQHYTSSPSFRLYLMRRSTASATGVEPSVSSTMIFDSCG